jgi:hypothetical protein
VLTHSGVHVTREFGAPTIRDIAVQSMRLVRWSGGGEVFWPIGMHCLLVADLMPKSLENPIRPMQEIPTDHWLDVHALLHDAAEVSVADVPRPMKTGEARAVEDSVQSRIFASLGVPEPTEAIKAAVKRADFRAALAEGACGCAGRGYQQTQTGFHNDPEAEQILRAYLARYNVADAINADGQWALWYEARLRQAMRAAQRAVSYAPEAEVQTPAPAAPTWRTVIDSPQQDVLCAIQALYRSQEHRPSYEAVRDVVMRAFQGREGKR